MTYLSYTIKALSSLVIVALTWLLCIPLALFFVDEQGNLKGWLRIFQSFDATLDAGWKDGYSGYYTWLPLWVLRAMWLARNPAYGYDYTVVGIPFDVKQWTVQRFEQTPDRIIFYATAPGAFNYVYIGHWCQIKLGWKAYNYYDNDKQAWMDITWGPDKRLPLCSTIVPRFNAAVTA